MKSVLLVLALSTATLHGQAVTNRAQATAPNPQYEGIWEGYDGEWGHVSRQLIALAEAIPADKYTWRPAPGVRSVSEVFMHIALANFYLLSVTGPKMPPDIKSDMERTVISKAEVIQFLRRSLDAVKQARAQLKPGDLQRRVEIEGKQSRSMACTCASSFTTTNTWAN